MPKPTRRPMKLATLADPEQPGPAVPEVQPAELAVPARPDPPPAARFFGVPFLKGGAREITAIHLCPAMVHLATIRDGSHLEVANRLTFRSVDLGDLAQARSIAFRPRAAGEDTLELAIIGSPDRPEIARFDLRDGRPLAGLPMPVPSAIQYSGDSRFVAAGSRAGDVRAWLLGPRGPSLVLEDHFGGQVESLAFHPEHPTLYATLASGELAEIALAPSQAAPASVALRQRAPGARFHQVAAGRRGYPIYLAGRDDKVYVVDTATGEVGVFAPQVGPITSLQILPASGHLCVVGPNAVYLLESVGSAQKEHLALLCPFDEHVYAAWELDAGAVLVFHAAEEPDPTAPDRPAPAGT